MPVSQKAGRFLSQIPLFSIYVYTSESVRVLYEAAAAVRARACVNVSIVFLFLYVCHLDFLYILHCKYNNIEIEIKQLFGWSHIHIV